MPRGAPVGTPHGIQALLAGFAVRLVDRAGLRHWRRAGCLDRGAVATAGNGVELAGVDGRLLGAAVSYTHLTLPTTPYV